MHVDHDTRFCLVRYYQVSSQVSQRDQRVSSRDLSLIFQIFSINDFQYYSSIKVHFASEAQTTSRCKGIPYWLVDNTAV